METIIENIETVGISAEKAIAIDRKNQAARVRAEIREKEKKLYEFFKRAFDIILSALALVVLCIPMLIIAAIIYLNDRGAPVFSQERTGKRGKLFKLYKFRTMVPNAEEIKSSLEDQNEMDGPVFKIKDDPRITKVGKILRKTSLDELPQLINILRGDMSIVGPRPALPNEVVEYTDYQKIRLEITPGLTCLWQIQPRRNDLSFDEWVDLDVRYIKNRSFMKDLKIILKTVVVVFKCEGR